MPSARRHVFVAHLVDGHLERCARDLDSILAITDFILHLAEGRHVGYRPTPDLHGLLIYAVRKSYSPEGQTPPQDAQFSKADPPFTPCDRQSNDPLLPFRQKVWTATMYCSRTYRGRMRIGHFLPKEEVHANGLSL